MSMRSMKPHRTNAISVSLRISFLNWNLEIPLDSSVANWRCTESETHSICRKVSESSKTKCYLIAPCRGPKTVLDSGFQARDSGFQLLDFTLCQWNLDSRFQTLVRFRIPWAEFRDFVSRFRIRVSVSGFRILVCGFRYPNSVTRGLV